MSTLMGNPYWLSNANGGPGGIFIPPQLPQITDTLPPPGFLQPYTNNTLESYAQSGPMLPPMAHPLLFPYLNELLQPHSDSYGNGLLPGPFIPVPGGMLSLGQACPPGMFMPFGFPILPPQLPPQPMPFHTRPPIVNQPRPNRGRGNGNGRRNGYQRVRYAPRLSPQPCSLSSTPSPPKSPEIAVNTPPLTPPENLLRPSRPLNPYSVPFFPRGYVEENSIVSNSSTETDEEVAMAMNPTALEMEVQHHVEPLSLPRIPPGIIYPADLIEELPFVTNFTDVNKVPHLRPVTNFVYYVPPKVDDDDFFGGQMRIWQEKMIPTFGCFLPELWFLQGLSTAPANDLSGTLLGQFTITCKLRFCCRHCMRPWTSMRGKIHFAFGFDSALRLGLILMRIFGQVCNHEKCSDRTFQTAACYPEEIERVLRKLSEYVGYVVYQLPLSPQFYSEPDKALRIGNPRSPHRPSLCQACQQGICTR